MKSNLLKRASLFCFAVASCYFSVSAATAYCETPITATDGATTVNLTCQSTGENQYEFKITSDAEMTGFNKESLWMRINGGDTYQFAQDMILSPDQKSITLTINSTTAPDIYSPIMFIIIQGEKRFDLPNDIDWGATCGTGIPDTESPTAFTAVKGDVTFNSVQLLLNAADNSGSVKYTITYDTDKHASVTGVSEVEKPYVISGLTQNTEYTFSITAQDAAGNTASNNPIVINTTTTAFPASPEPIKPAADVISIFSDTYTPAFENVNFNPNWGQSTKVETINVDGNNVLEYTTLNYQGIDFGGNLDASSMDYLHLDVLTTDETELHVFCIGNNPQNEKHVVINSINFGTWNSFDIPLSEYTNQELLLTSLFQLKIVGSGHLGSSKKSIYLDNIYFHKIGQTSAIDETNAETIRCFPNPVLSDLTVQAESEISQLTICNLMGQMVRSIDVNFHVKSINLGELGSGNYIVYMRLSNGKTVIRKIVKL